MITKTLWSVAVGLALWLLPPQSVQAQSLYFYLFNNTGYTIAKVYVSPSEHTRWGSNLIPYDYVYHGKQLYIYIPDDYGSTCYFDLEVVAIDGTWWKFTYLDICSLYRITVNWNGTYYTEWE